MERVGPAVPAEDKTPRTERGRRTLRKLLDAAAVEFGERGFHEASISGITRQICASLPGIETVLIEAGALAPAAQRLRNALRTARQRGLLTA